MYYVLYNSLNIFRNLYSTLYVRTFMDTTFVCPDFR